MTNKTSISDLPFVENVNDFGTERYVKGLIKFIENSATPLTIALQGEWGSGKTSLMTRLERALCSTPESPFIGVEINTWEYSMMASPEATVYNILVQLVHELSGDDTNSKKTFKSFLRGAGNFIYRGARESLKTIPGIGGMLAVGLEAANVPAQLPEYSEDNCNSSLSDLKKALAEAISKSIDKANKRGVIVFVDDLDRLNPPVAVEILELLKNIFTLDHCIFVLAIDYDVVVKGLKPKFGELTEKNEREFRSFFDKIIQVPFSLPVNNYRPMDFVLNSLADIGYIKEIDTKDPQVRSLYTTVVNVSVGKNPRSIKRLINTLSLLDCIAQCGSNDDTTATEDSFEDKLLNFIIVSIQICYPKIYCMLSRNPEFTGWDVQYAQKWGIRIENARIDDDPDPQWVDIVKAACAPDAYLTQHSSDIVGLFDLILDIFGKTNLTESQQLGKKMKEVMDKSSVTGIHSEFKVEDFDKKIKQMLIQKLHDNVKTRLTEKRPDINNYKFKRNTGNGGIYINIEDGYCLDVTFTPSVTPDGKIKLCLRLNLSLNIPERLKGKSFEEMLREAELGKFITDFDSVISPLLKNCWFFKGTVYDGNISYFDSYLDELRYLQGDSLMGDELTSNPEYGIELDKTSYFEDDKIVNTIADVLIAGYDFRKSLKDFK